MALASRLMRGDTTTVCPNAAQANCFEALPFFIGAVALAQQAGVDVARLEILAVFYVALRVMYVAMYIADWASARTLAWTLAFAINIAILFSGATGS
jgi:uncharacterized MAPEG superfamily protein